MRPKLGFVASLLGGLVLPLGTAHSADSFSKPDLPFEAVAERMSAAPPGQVGIYFGKPAGAYPFQVALVSGSTEPGKEYEGQFCAGTLIDKRWVLTASHCTVTYDDDGNVVSLKPQDIDIYAGSQNFTGGDRIKVAKVITHPKFDIETYDLDVGLLLLARAPKADAKVGTIVAVDPADEQTYAAPGSKVKAIGWGVTEEGEYPTDLREVSVEMLDPKLCNAGIVQYRLESSQETLDQIARQLRVKPDAMKQIKDLLANNTGEILSENMICAGIEGSGEDTCSGDNGGPLFAETSDKKFIQVGLVSWGDTCGGGEQSLYGIYTRLANLNAWIKETMQSTPVSDEAAEPSGGGE
jgi:secreted trypsin-like serine protease